MQFIRNVFNNLARKLLSRYLQFIVLFTLFCLSACLHAVENELQVEGGMRYCWFGFSSNGQCSITYNFSVKMSRNGYLVDTITDRSDPLGARTSGARSIYANNKAQTIYLTGDLKPDGQYEYGAIVRLLNTKHEDVTKIDTASMLLLLTFSSCCGSEWTSDLLTQFHKSLFDDVSMSDMQIAMDSDLSTLPKDVITWHSPNYRTISGHFTTKSIKKSLFSPASRYRSGFKRGVLNVAQSINVDSEVIPAKISLLHYYPQINSTNATNVSLIELTSITVTNARIKEAQPITVSIVGNVGVTDYRFTNKYPSPLQYGLQDQAFIPYNDPQIYEIISNLQGRVELPNTRK